ncbi:MAG TPA: energy transducer TonB [Kiritimatiellia bacterium]|nr:energy transducer TonB [Kiritimatiellia bacterium]
MSASVGQYARDLGAAPRWTWQSIIWATLVTALLFLALPLLEKFTAPASPDVMTRPVDVIHLPPPPPPPPPVRPLEQEARQTPRPAMDRPPPKLQPLALSFSLGSAMGGLKGDFFVDFALGGIEGDLDADSFVFEIADLDEPPRPRIQLPPAYPAQARIRRVQGHVDLMYIVSSEGLVTDVRVVDSHPPGIFDQAALQAVRRWQFQPGIRQGMAVTTRVEQRLSFQLEP